MTLGGYFMLKSVFGQQGCRALTFALARLSCTSRQHIIGHFGDESFRGSCSVNVQWCKSSSSAPTELH